MVLIVFQWLLNMSLIMHPFYVSYTDVEYNSKSQSIEISVRIFSDDLEKALNSECKCKIDVLNPSYKKLTEQWVNVYLQKNLIIKGENKNLILKFIGLEHKEGSTWSYFEILNIPSIKKVEVVNKILFALHDEQTNMMHFKINGISKTIKLDNPESYYSALF